MSVPEERFKWEQGEHQLSRYESSPGKFRYFCQNCGSQLIANRPATDYVLIRAGSIDTKLTEQPKVHFWCADGASWYDPNERLPVLPEGVP